VGTKEHCGDISVSPFDTQKCQFHRTISMNQLLLRRCKSCQQPLAEDARPDRKCCSDMCQHREKVRRFRERHNPQTRTTIDQLETTEEELAELQNEHR